mgnify:CR=1 FL=1
MASTPASDATGGSYVVTYAITGVDSSNLIHVNLFKNFLFFVEESATASEEVFILQAAAVEEVLRSHLASLRIHLVVVLHATYRGLCRLTCSRQTGYAT